MRSFKIRPIFLAVTIAFTSLFAVVPSRVAVAQTPCATWLRVIDISSNNRHPLGWTQLVKAGIAGAYIKNTEGVNYTNPYWTSDARDATRAGVPWGVYQFAQPGKTDAVASAKYFLAQGGNNGQLPPALDLEVTTLSPEATARWALLWLQTVQAMTNRAPIIYVGAFFPASQYPFLAPYDLWLPAYPNGYQPVANVCSLPSPRLPAPWRNTGWQMWQFTSVAEPNGTHNNTDLSVAESSWFTKWTGAGYNQSNNGKPANPLYTTGSHGIKVVQIQTLLIQQGLLPKGSNDGVFGLQTKQALEVYQQRIGIKGDGVWSNETQTASDFFLKYHRTMKQDELCKSMGVEMKTKKADIKL
jgi:lysozyme